MPTATLVLLIVTAACFYCMGASWLLQFVAYPTYALVGAKEFVPYHIRFGQRLLIVVVPMVLTCFGMIALVFVRPVGAPTWAVGVVTACAAVVLLTTAILEVPKHIQLDRQGKSSALIAALVRDNIPRTVAWTLGAIILAYLLSLQIVR